MERNQAIAKTGCPYPAVAHLIFPFSKHQWANGTDDYAALIDPTRSRSISLKGAAQCQEDAHQPLSLEQANHDLAPFCIRIGFAEPVRSWRYYLT
ncbi:hypothetical protein CF142_14505 [Aeromonas caviae]|nr:hypothetical protein CF142_14505 [Aeromonas caviae]